MMSDLRECVTGDTLVVLADGRRVPIETLVGTTPKVISLNDQGKLVQAQADLVWQVGVRSVYKLTTASGQQIQATSQHRLYSFKGWQCIQNLRPGSRIAVAQGIGNPQMVASGVNSYGDSSLKSLQSQQAIFSYADGLANKVSETIAATNIFWDEVLSIEPVGEAPVYDLTVPGPASWLADGMVSHNSGAIEQDADLIMMLYREEYYDPDTPDRGIAEIIITKHRNGPTGTIKLLFEPQFTRFRNLASPGV
jgi:replicative DNA helicase